MKDQKKKQKAPDPLSALKYRGYCWALTPPGDDTSLQDLVCFAKFYLCRHAKKLWKDPVWESYTDEEILIEYFAHLFSTDKGARTQFEAQTFTGTDMYGEDIYDWLDRMVEQNQRENAKKLDEMSEKVEFSPETGRDKEE